MPHGSELMMLPQREPLVYNILLDKFEIIGHNPFNPKEKIFPVAVFNSPGYVKRGWKSSKGEFKAPNLHILPN